ncbi:PACE efflux transporter [Pseudodesulfovibrio sp.]|nr:PACE efflux transporter [Pseudodesulfovibrio sp.]
MRTQADRIRHTILFEGIALITVTPLAAWILDRNMAQIGSMAIFLSVAAMGCNYLFNLAFDHLLKKLGRPVHHRPPKLRIIHALLFEGSFLVVTVPVVAWWLDMTLWAAFVTDMGFAVFFLLYAYVFNWAYDCICPMPMDDVQPGPTQG